MPKEYRVTPTPTVPGRPDPEKVEMDAAPAGQNAAQPKEQAQEPRPVISIILTSEKPADKLKEITDRLEQGITELFESERYKEYLRVMSKFHNYSFNNTLLIAMQKPDASLVAGFSSWKNNFGRSVMKGEKGIKIIAPSPFTVKQEVEKTDPQTGKPVIGKDGKPVTEEKEIKVPAYKVVSVFDVSQTEGRELPDIAVNELTGDVDRFKDFFSALEQASPVPVGFEKIEGGAHGYYHLEEKRIAIDEGMSDLQTLKTAIHEIAHAKLHDIDLNAPKEEQKPRVDRRTREVEAESVAYTVCQHYGLDTSDYSFGYVAGWSSGKELAELRGSLETIRSTAAEMINSIDGHFAELQKVQEKEKAQPQHEGNTPAQKSETQAKDAPREKAAMPEYIYKIETNPRSDSREKLRPGDFKAHVATLHDNRIEREACRVVEKMKSLQEPNSPDKTRFMVELSPCFVRLATDKDADRLFSMLPYKTLAFSKSKDRFGTYALIDKGEDRSKGIRKPRPSVRAQLAAGKEKAAPKKAAAKTRQKEMEV